VKDLIRKLAFMLWNIDVDGTSILIGIANILSGFCTYDYLQCPTFQFQLDSKEIKLCWNTLCLIMNLSQCEAQFVKKVLIDHNCNWYYWKKVFKQVNFLQKNAKQHKNHVWHNCFCKYFVIVTQESVKAICVIKKIGM